MRRLIARRSRLCWSLTALLLLLYLAFVIIAEVAPALFLSPLLPGAALPSGIAVGTLVMHREWRDGTERSVERPAIGRRSSECQTDLVNYLLPGPVSPPATPADEELNLPRSGEILESVGGFNEQYRKGQDYDLWLRIAARFPFLRYPSSLALYRQHTASITGKYIDRNYPAIIVEDAIRSYGLAGPDGQKVLESTMNSRLRKLWSDYADICQANRQYDAATNAMVNARQYQFRYTDSLRLLRVRLERLLHRVE